MFRCFLKNCFIRNIFHVSDNVSERLRQETTIRTENKIECGKTFFFVTSHNKFSICILPTFMCSKGILSKNLMNKAVRLTRPSTIEIYDIKNSCNK